MKYKKIILILLICISIPIVIGSSVFGHIAINNYLESLEINTCEKSGGIYFHGNHECQYTKIVNGTTTIYIP